jgi:VanZ family protein
VKPTKNLLVLKKLVLGMATFWTLLILFLCLVQLNNVPSVGIKGADKYVHFTFHFIFTLLWCVYFFLLIKKVTFKHLGSVLVVSLLFGILIELLQGAFTTTRQADTFDVLANFTGACVGIILMLGFKQYVEKQQ